MSPPLDPLLCAGFVLAAFAAAGLVHSLWLRSRWSARWRVPIDGGRCWRDRPLLGANKTWAGFLVLPPAAGAAFALLRVAADGMPPAWREGLWPLPVAGYALLGVCTGLGFMAGELPNSFIKRQCGVRAGTAPATQPARALCFLGDRLDSALGAILAQALIVPIGLTYVCCLLLVGPGLHWLFSALLYQLGVKGRRS